MKFDHPPASPETMKLIQLALAVLIGVGLVLLFSQSVWVPTVVEFQLEREGLSSYYYNEV